MTDAPHIFSQLTHLSNHPGVTLANGSTAKVEGIGSVPLFPTLNLTSVLHLPSFPFNLFSVSQLTKQHNCLVTFSPSSVMIQDLTTREKIGGGHETRGLYYLKISTRTACTAIASPMEIHCRLSHPSL